MQNIINKILNSELLAKALNSELLSGVLDYIYGLSSTEVTILVVITVILTLIMAYHWLGVYFMFGLMLIYLFVYILYEVDVFDVYEEQSSIIDRRERLLEIELEK